MSGPPGARPTTWARHPLLLHRSTSIGPVVLRPDAAAPERIDGLGAVVLELLDRAMTAPEIDAHLADLGSTGDAEALLTELAERGLVVEHR